MNARLALLDSVEQGVTESEVLRLALQHAVAELDALGGTIHLRGPMSALRLVSAAGLPPALTRPWEIIDQEGPRPRRAPCARAAACGCSARPSGTGPPHVGHRLARHGPGSRTGVRRGPQRSARSPW